MATTSTTAAGEIRQYVPDVKPPRPGVWQKLSPQDRRVLNKYLNEALDCVYQGKFGCAETETELFGSVDGSASAIHHCTVPGYQGTTLTAQDERFLFEQYNYARFRISAVLRRHSGRPLSANGVSDLLLWGHRALQTRSIIIQLNMPLVLSMAKRSRLEGLDFNEMISEGNLALIRSVEKFDATRGFKFSTYACRAILKSFSRVAMRASRYRGLFPVELTTELERSDFLDRQRENVEKDYVDELKHILGTNVAHLSEVERTVIYERFAIGGLPGTAVESKTLEQVGEIIGVTKERVRQIQNKALQKIRHALENQTAAA